MPIGYACGRQTFGVYYHCDDWERFSGAQVQISKTFALISAEAKYMALSLCVQEVR